MLVYQPHFFRNISLLRYFSLICAFVFLSACDEKSIDNSALVELSGKTMGTYFNVKYVPPHNLKEESIFKEKIEVAIQKRLEEINQEISTYQSDSHLSIFNKARNTEPLKISDDIAKNILISQYVGRKTDGAMDITVGPLVNLWGFGPDKVPEKIPSLEEISLAKEKSGLHLLTLYSNNEGFYLQKKDPDVYVDLSTVGEGFGADEIGTLLRQFGISNYLVSIGGTITSQGKPSPNSDWRVAIEKPTDTEVAVQEIINLQGQSISTAGSYRNYYEKEGIRYSHVIDPSTGRPITHKLISSTVISPTALEADAWDTGLMVLGKEKAFEIAEKNGLAVYLISKTPEGFEVKMTESFKAFLVKE